MSDDDATLTNYREGRWIRRNAEACVKQLVQIADRKNDRLARAMALLRKCRAECGMSRVSYLLSPQDYDQIDALLKENA